MPFDDPVRLSAKDEILGSLTLFPADALQFRTVVRGLRIAKAEISDQAPIRGNIENPGNHGWIEDRYPTHADAFGARRQPHRKDGGHDGIIRHLGHGAAAEAMACSR